MGISLLSGRLYTVYAQENDRLSKDATFGNRVYTYITKLSRQKNIQMDMRVYRQQEMIDHLSSQNRVFTATGTFGRAALGKPGTCYSLATSMSAIAIGCIYVFTCLKAWAGAFDIGLVTQYVGAATALAESLNILISSLGAMKANTTHLDNTFRYLDLPNTMYQGSLTTEKRADRNYQLEFRNVSFKYPGSETWALKNVSMKFQIGKRLAIVGENGSGKTTFIKLLCRLYDPQEGEILLNGIDIRKYRYDDYMGVFSIVFQDFQLISQSLGSNVAGSVDYDPQRVKQALADAGFGPRLESLPKGLDTQLYKDYGEDGIEVSGGEAQKIAIAGRCIRTRPSSSWTSPPPPLIPWPRQRSTPSSTRSPATKPPSTSATGCPAASSAMRFWSSTGEASSSRAPTRHCWNRPPANTPSFGTLRRSITQRNCKITHIIICVTCIDK